jgi:hypothetical protein
MTPIASTIRNCSSFFMGPQIDRSWVIVQIALTTILGHLSLTFMIWCERGRQRA